MINEKYELNGLDLLRIVNIGIMANPDKPTLALLQNISAHICMTIDERKMDVEIPASRIDKIAVTISIE